MTTYTSGSFGTLSSNQSKLNTRKGRNFLWNNATLRFKDGSQTLHMPDESKNKKIMRLVKENISQQRQNSFLILVIAILTVKLMLSLVA